MTIVNAMRYVIVGLFTAVQVLLTASRDSLLSALNIEKKYGIWLWILSIAPFFCLYKAILLQGKSNALAENPYMEAAYWWLHAGMILSLLMWHFLYSRHITFKRSAGQVLGLKVEKLDILDYIGVIVTFTLLSFTVVEAIWFWKPLAKMEKLQNVGILAILILSYNIVQNRYRIGHILFWVAVVAGGYLLYDYVKSMPKSWISTTMSEEGTRSIHNSFPYNTPKTVVLDEKEQLVYANGEPLKVKGLISFESDKGGSCWEIYLGDRNSKGGYDKHAWRTPGKDPYHYVAHSGFLNLRAKNSIRCLPTRVSITCKSEDGCGG